MSQVCLALSHGNKSQHIMKFVRGQNASRSHRLTPKPIMRSSAAYVLGNGKFDVESYYRLVYYLKSLSHSS